MPEADFFVRQNDTASSITATLQDADGVAVNIENAAVRFHMALISGGAVKVSAAANNDQVGDGSDGSTGQVSYDWVAGDLDAAGLFIAEWEVTYGAGAIQTFPNSGYVLVRVTPQISSEPV